MNKIGLRRIISSRYTLAVAGGLFLSCGFPNIGVAGLAWLGPGLIAAAAMGTPAPEALRVGFVAGFAHFLSLLYWLLLIPYRWHGVPFGPALGWLALSAFSALFVATWAFLVSAYATLWAKRSESVPGAELPPSSFHVIDRFPGSLRTVLPGIWAARMAWMLGGAVTWVALEMLRARLFGGFPWSPLGASQYQLTPLIQIASVTGVYGLSFLVVWTSLSLLSAGLMMVRKPGARSVGVAEMFIPVLVTALLFNLGLRQIRQGLIQANSAPRKLRVMLIQPSIPQTLIWNPSQDTNRFQELVSYTAQVLTNRSDLVVWPESSIPKMLRYDTNTFNALSHLARANKVWLILGSDDAEPRRNPSGGRDEPDYFNSSFLLNSAGELAQRYIKRNLVIFGEYVPLRRWLPFLQWFTPVEGGFTPGTEPAEFVLRDLDVRICVWICFEDIFPQLGPSDVKPNTDFLVNITNDGWFGESAAQWQQATAALFRTVENGVPLIRCCNNGVTCWIDAQGRIREIFRDEKGTVYGPGHLLVEIPILDHAARVARTFYNLHGDVFGWVCSAATGGLLLILLRRRRKAPAGV